LATARATSDGFMPAALACRRARVTMPSNSDIKGGEMAFKMTTSF
jgi:hypothetical protein